MGASCFGLFRSKKHETIGGGRLPGVSAGYVRCLLRVVRERLLDKQLTHGSVEASEAPSWRSVGGHACGLARDTMGRVTESRGNVIVWRATGQKTEAQMIQPHHEAKAAPMMPNSRRESSGNR